MVQHSKFQMSKNKCWCQQCQLWFDSLEQYQEFHNHNAIKNLKHNPLNSEICIQMFDDVVTAIGILNAKIDGSDKSLNVLNTKILNLANQVNSYSFEVPFRLNVSSTKESGYCLFFLKDDIIYFDLKYKGIIKENKQNCSIDIIYPVNEMVMGQGSIIIERNCIFKDQNSILSLELSKHQNGYLQLFLKKNYNTNPHWNASQSAELHLTGSIMLSHLDFPIEGKNLILYSLSSKSYLCCTSDGWKFVDDYSTNNGCLLFIHHSEKYSTIQSMYKKCYLGSSGSYTANPALNEEDANLIFEFASHKIGGIFMIHDSKNNYLVCNENGNAGFSFNKSIFIIRKL